MSVKFGRSKSERCAKEIIEFLLDHHLWQDTCVYANGKRFVDYDRDTKTYHYYNSEDDTVDPWSCVFVEDNMDPRNYFSYNGDFLSMSFEGPLYEIFNYYLPCDYCDNIIKEFNEIIGKYGFYYELGNEWNLSLYKN